MTDRDLRDETEDTGGIISYTEEAQNNRLFLRNRRRNDEEPDAARWDWALDTESPNITRFIYDVLVDADPDADIEQLQRVGTIDGYILSNDGRDESLDLWDQADALDSDIEAYVTCLKIELKAIDELSGLAPELEWFPRILIVRHFEPAEGVDSIDMITKAVAAVAMKEGPMLLMVDPREMPALRQAAAGKLKGKTHTAALIQRLGLVRMICCRSVWGWHDFHDLMSNEHSYMDLVAAKKEGKLDQVLSGLTPDEE